MCLIFDKKALKLIHEEALDLIKEFPTTLSGLPEFSEVRSIQTYCFTRAVLQHLIRKGEVLTDEHKFQYSTEYYVKY